MADQHAGHWATTKARSLEARQTRQRLPKEPLNEQDDLRKYAITSSGEEQVCEAEKKFNQEAAYRPFFI
ncbi:hypothetical protein ACLQ2H_08460 [Streptomyces globisporus]|uniref:hypothetical protein n=1 Tax=Streptomyces globisporus TaxID=1908 RepID=UPI003CECAEB4